MSSGKPYPPTRPDGHYVNRPVLAKHRILMTRALRTFFNAQIEPVCAQIGLQLGLNKVEDTDKKVGDTVSTVRIDWQPLAEEVEPYLAVVAASGGQLAAEQLGVSLDDSFSAGMRVRANDWARQRSAELVGMKREGDFYVENPDPKWAIDATTRDMLRGEVRKAIEQGWSTQELARRLRQSYAFSHERARTIARTEIAQADGSGALLGWIQSGVVDGKSWHVDIEPCLTCLGYATMGVVPLDYQYAPGVRSAPGHPNCECTLLPELTDEMELPR